MAGTVLGLALAGCAMQPAKAQGGCGIEVFQGSWVAADQRDERFVIGTDAVTVMVGTANVRLPLRPARDVAERGLGTLTTEMPQVAALHAARLSALGRPDRRICMLRLATPGGSVAFLPSGEGLLRLEEARSDPPVAQQLSRATRQPTPRTAPDFSQPPR